MPFKHSNALLLYGRITDIAVVPRWTPKEEPCQYTSCWPNLDPSFFKKTTAAVNHLADHKIFAEKWSDALDLF